MSDDFVMEKAPESKAPELLPNDSEHPARVVKMERKLMPFKDDEGNDIYKVEGTFELQGDEYTFVGREGDVLQRRVYGNVSAVFNDSPYCRLRAWVMEILGADELPEGFRFSLQDLVGNDVRVIVEIHEYPDKKAPRNLWTEDINTGELVAPKKQINRVKDVLRADYGGSLASTSTASVNTQASTVDDMEEEPF